MRNTTPTTYRNSQGQPSRDSRRHPQQHYVSLTFWESSPNLQRTDPFLGAVRVNVSPQYETMKRIPWSLVILIILLVILLGMRRREHMCRPKGEALANSPDVVEACAKQNGVLNGGECTCPE